MNCLISDGAYATSHKNIYGTPINKRKSPHSKKHVVGREKTLSVDSSQRILTTSQADPPDVLSVETRPYPADNPHLLTNLEISKI